MRSEGKLEALLDKKFAQQDKKLDALDAKFAQQDKKLDKKFAQQDKNFQELDSKFDNKFKELDNKLKALDDRLSQFETLSLWSRTAGARHLEAAGGPGYAPALSGLVEPSDRWKRERPYRR